MKEIVVTQYVAEDGTKFETKEKCLAYEEKYKETSELRKAIRKIKDLCDNMDCKFCPFGDNSGDCNFPHGPHNPDEWDIPQG